MHVFDPANVVNVIHENAAPQRLALDVADKMTFVVPRINAVV